MQRLIILSMFISGNTGAQIPTQPTPKLMQMTSYNASGDTTIGKISPDGDYMEIINVKGLITSRGELKNGSRNGVYAHDTTK